MDLSLPTVDSPKFDASPWGDVWKDLPGTRPSMHFLVNKEIRQIETNRWVVKPKDERPTKGWNLKIQIGGRWIFLLKKRGEKKSPPPPGRKKENSKSDRIISSLQSNVIFLGSTTLRRYPIGDVKVCNALWLGRSCCLSGWIGRSWLLRAFCLWCVCDVGVWLLVTSCEANRLLHLNNSRSNNYSSRNSNNKKNNKKNKNKNKNKNNNQYSISRWALALSWKPSNKTSRFMPELLGQLPGESKEEKIWMKRHWCLLGRWKEAVNSSQVPCFGWVSRLPLDSGV